MLRKTLRVGLSLVLACTVLIGACPECQPREVSPHSCCDPDPGSASASQCPDRNEILRNFEKPQVPDVTVSLVALGPAPVASVAPVAALASALEIAPCAEGPPDLFLRNAAILI